MISRVLSEAIGTRCMIEASNCSPRRQAEAGDEQPVNSEQLLPYHIGYLNRGPSGLGCFQVVLLDNQCGGRLKRSFVFRVPVECEGYLDIHGGWINSPGDHFVLSLEFSYCRCPLSVKNPNCSTQLIPTTQLLPRHPGCRSQSLMETPRARLR